MSRPSPRLLAALLVVAGFAAAGGWAARTLLLPPEPLPQSRPYTVVAVRQGEIQRLLTLNVAARWSGGTAVVNASSGTLTQVKAKNGTQVKAGAILFTVDLKPTIMAQGSVPAFRDLEVGSEGADVRQLQELLVVVGVRAQRPDGKYGAGTASEVRQWQRALGVEPLGRVPLGTIIFVPALPGTFAWSDGVKAGTRLSVGTSVGRLLPSAPSFNMTIPKNQSTLVASGMPVTIYADSQKWAARLGAIAPPTEDGSTIAQVIAAEGERSPCGDACGTVPLSGNAALRATVTVVPKQSGAIVPTAALVVDAKGLSAVTRQDGTAVPVRVLATSGGQALVAGVGIDTLVRVPASSSGSS